MKKLTYILFAVIMFMATKMPVSAQSTEDRQVTGFKSIGVSGPFTVHVSINGTESLKISSKPDVINDIETFVEDSILKIKFKDDLKDGEGESDRPIDIYVTAKSLTSISNVGSGSITVDGDITGDKVMIVLNGAGTIQSPVKSTNLQVIMKGAGHVRLSGTTEKAKVIVEGAGEINGRNLKTNDASVVIEGSGNVYFSAEKTVSANIVGPGSVYYSGNATITQKNVIGAGGISKTN